MIIDLSSLFQTTFDFSSRFDHLEEEVRKLMATVQELAAEITRLTANVQQLKTAQEAEKAEVTAALANLTAANEDLAAQIKVLEDIIAAGNSIDQATFDALKAAADEVATQTAAVSNIYTAS